MRLTVLRVPIDAAEIATDRLWAAGARGVEEIDAMGSVELRALLAADDATSLSRLGALPAGWMVAFEEVPDAPPETWRDHVRPIRVNRELVIVPAWQAEASGGAAGVRVEIEPAGSFGLGDHPTTRLSADATWRLVADGDRVLDVGCGSGVLAVIAALRGASAVVAVDVAEAAFEATVANAERNGVSDRIDASTAPLSEIDGSFDVVLANILAPTLIELAPDLARLTAASGTLVVSGVLAGSYDHVLAALAPMAPMRSAELDGWAVVELRHS